MSAVATCPQCRLQLSVPSEADALSVVKCPVCRSQFELQSVTIAPVLEMIVVPPPPSEEDEASATAFESPESEDLSQEPNFALADESVDEVDGDKVVDESDDESGYASDETVAFDSPIAPQLEDEPSDDLSAQDDSLAEEPTDWDNQPDADSVPDEPVNESLRETIELTDELTDELEGLEPDLEPEAEQASEAFTAPPESPTFSARDTLENLSIGTTVANFAAQSKDLQRWSGIVDQDDAPLEDAPSEEVDALPEVEKTVEEPESTDDTFAAGILDYTTETLDPETHSTESSQPPEETTDETAPESTSPATFTVDSIADSTVDEISLEPTYETPIYESEIEPVDDPVAVEDTVSLEDTVEPPPVADSESWPLTDAETDETATMEFSSDDAESIQSPEAAESDFEFDAETTTPESLNATVEYETPGYEAPPTSAHEPTEWVEPESELGSEETGGADISADITTMPTAAEYEPIEEPAGQPWMDVAERPAYDDSPVDSRPEETEEIEVADLEPQPEEDPPEAFRAPTPNRYQPPIPGIGIGNHSEDPASRSILTLIGMAGAGTLAVGLLGLGGWVAFDRFVGNNNSTAVSSVAQANSTPPAESGLQQASFETETPNADAVRSNLNEPASFDPGRYGNIETAPIDQPQPHVANAPSYSMDQLAMALDRVQKRERPFASARLDDPNTRGTLANAYIAYCDLAEALTYVQDEPIRADRMMILLDSKDVFRAAVQDKGKRLDVSRLAKFWAEKSDRPHNGIFIAGQLKSVRRQGSVQEYQMESDLGEPWTFIMPKRIDRKIFSVGVELVVAGSLLTDPAQRISGYTGNAQTVVWASSVKALDRSNGARKSPAMDPLTAMPTR